MLVLRIQSKNVPSIASLHLKKWVKAWETQDVDKYFSLYSENFKGKNKYPQRLESIERKSTCWEK